MADDHDQDACDRWQDRLLNETYRLSAALKELHETNPWPESPVLDQAISTLATELWDQCFGLTEIRNAFESAAADLPRYAAGQEKRP